MQKTNLSLCLIYIMAVFFCASCSNQSEKYEPFKDYNFDMGDYRFYGFVIGANSTELTDQYGDFYIENKEVLNRIKENWVFQSTPDAMACGYDYAFRLAKKDSVLLELKVNMECSYMVFEGRWHRFDTKLLKEIPDEHRKRLTNGQNPLPEY